MQALFDELKREGKTGLLDKCVAALQQLERELQQQIQINQEQKHLISILTDTKEYYEQEYRHNSYQEQCKNLAAELTRANTLVAAHRKATQELRDSMIILQEKAEQLQLRVQVLERNMVQKEAEIEEKERLIRQQRSEKEVLQAEWNKVVRAVKRKMASLQQKSQANKQNRIPLAKGKVKELEGQLGLMERAHKMIARLQREEAIDEFQGIFLSSQGSKRSYALQENRQVSALFNSAAK